MYPTLCSVSIGQEQKKADNILLDTWKIDEDHRLPSYGKEIRQ